MNARQRKALSRSPLTVQTIFKCLPSGWATRPVHAITMGWSVELTFKNVEFALAEHKLHLEIYVKRDGKWQVIQTPEKASPQALAKTLELTAAEILKG